MERAYTQYTDFSGTAAGDYYPDERLGALVGAAGVDLEQYIPVGVQIWGTPPRIVAIYAIEKHGEETRDFEALQRFVRERPGEVRLKEFLLPEDAKIERHFKQFKAILANKELDLSEIEVSN